MCAKHNKVAPDKFFCVTVNSVGERRSNISKVHCFAHLRPAAMHAMSGVTNKKEWMLSKAACLTHEFKICVHSKHAK